MAHDDPVIAVLFDAAGTLLRLREPIGHTYARHAGHFGFALQPAAVEAAFRTAFREMPPMVFADAPASQVTGLERQWWRDLVAKTIRGADRSAPMRDFQEYFDRLFDHYARATAWETVPGAHDLLAELRRRRLRTGVVSNFDHRLPSLLDGLGLGPFLDTVVLPRDAGAAKPDPRIFTLALRRLGVTARQALYVGDDAEEDSAAASKVGMYAIDAASLAPLTRLLERLGTSR